MMSSYPFKNHIITFTTLAFLVVLGGSACDILGDKNDQEGDQGTLTVLMGDAPLPVHLVDTALVTIDSLVVRTSGEGSDSNFITLTSEPQTYNLLDLRNGAVAALSELEVPVGSYNLVRLYVNNAAARVVLVDGSTPPLKVPSGEQTGIKVFVDPPIQIVAGETAELLLDFDAGKSFLAQGNMDSPAGIKRVTFKPTLRAVNLSAAGEVAGTVADSSLQVIPDARVWAEQDSVISVTYTDTSGTYALVGLPVGTYSLHAWAAGYDSVSVADVLVEAGATRTVDLLLPVQ